MAHPLRTHAHRIVATISIAWAYLCAQILAEERQAAAPIDLRSEYLIDVWQTDQGLPDNFITSIAQTPDGYLWVGTFDGLARFNGFEFRTFDRANTPELPDDRILDLTLDGAGRLWIRSQSGQFTSWQNGHFRLFGEHDGLPLVEYPAFHLGRDGTFLWARKGTEKDYLKFDGNRFQPAQVEPDFETVFGQTRDREGYAMRVEAGILRSWNPKWLEPTAVPNFKLSEGWRVLASHDGGVLVIHANGIAKFRDGAWRDFGSLPTHTDVFEGYTEDHLGNLWIGVGFGEIWRLQPSGALTRFKLAESTISQPAKVFFEDAENNLWIGTGGFGLMRLKPRVVKSLDSHNGLASDVVRSVSASTDGTIWMATVNSIDSLRPNDGNNRATKIHPEIQLPWRVYGGNDGALWVGTFGEGLFRFKGREWNRYRTPRGTFAPPILKLLRTRAGEMFVGTSRGLFTVREDELHHCAPPGASGLLDVRALAEGTEGAVYAGLNGGGILRKSGNAWEKISTHEGLSGNDISALRVDHQDTLWIGVTGKGLSRLKNGAIFNYPESASLPRTISSIIDDDSGRLWFGSNQGLYCAELKELESVAESASAMPLVVRYDRTDGMGSSQCTSGACKSPDGRLWFATMSGVTVVDPKSLPRNLLPPPVVIEQILLDDRLASTQPGAALTIPPGRHRLEIRFAGLSFTAPHRVRYRYKLSGYDPHWVEAGNRRAAYYSGIGPGEYGFQVLAANNDGVWNETGATLAVIAKPFLWQRRSFQVTAIILLCAAAIALARYWAWLRLRRRLEELEQRHALDKERGRISRDLHDSLGADLSQLALWSEMALQAKDRPAVMAERAADVSNLTREVIQNVEEIVWTVNPRNDSLDKFANYLCEFAERVVTRGGLRFRWEAPASVPPIPLPSDIRHHIFLVAKEALNNIIKHADASEARVSLAIEDQSITIAIADDGRGFDVTAGNSNGGNGLANMRERLSACRGAASLESAPGRGTTIRLKVPLPNMADK